MDEIIAGIVLGIGVGLVLVIFFFVESASCHSQWENSGMRVSYGIMKGCTVQQKDGTWIPAKNYRSVE